MGSLKLRKLFSQSKIEEYLSNNDQILFTIDTHFDVTYNKSREGKHLPIYHCINGTKGHELVDPLKHLLIILMLFIRLMPLEYVMHVLQIDLLHTKRIFKKLSL